MFNLLIWWHMLFLSLIDETDSLQDVFEHIHACMQLLHICMHTVYNFKMNLYVVFI